MAIVRWYQPWASDNRNEVDLGACAAVLERGTVPMITWEPWDPGLNAKNLSHPEVNASYRLSRIIAGDYDAYIRTWARGIKALGGPVMLRPMHEMNGNWYPWCGTTNGNSPPQFKAAWIHIHKIFAEEGATNVTWVWSINHESVPATKANSFAAYYPGSAYVDWTSVSGFNWGTVSRWSSWKPWSHWYSAPLAYLERLGKPICISEMGTVEKGGNKAVWITDAYKRMPRYRHVRAVVYYNAREAGRAGTQDWRINSSVASRRAFRASVGAAAYSPGPVAALTEWQSRLSDADRRTLAAFQRIY